MAEEFSTKGAYVTGDAEFTRDTNYIEDRIVADPEALRSLPAPPASKVGSVGFGLSDGAVAWPVEAGRYRLVAANACPWANRAVIVRRGCRSRCGVSANAKNRTAMERCPVFLACANPNSFLSLFQNSSG